MSAPSVSELYNKYMFGIDLGDQKRMQYSTCRKAKKWYLYWFCFDLAIVNTLICMQESPNYKLLTKTNKEKRRTQVDFRMALAQQMIEAFRGSRRRKVPAVTGNCGDAQWLIQFEKPGIIRDVLKQNKRHKVSTGCRQYNIRLCIKNDCFFKYHQELL